MEPQTPPQSPQGQPAPVPQPPVNVTPPGPGPTPPTAPPAPTPPQPAVAASAPPQPQAPPPSPVPTETQRKFPTWLKVVLIVLAALVVFVIAITLLTNQTTKNAVKVSDQLVKDIQADNESAAYRLTAPNFKQATSNEQLTELLKKISPALQGQTKITDKTATKVAGQPAIAVIVYSVKTSAGTKYIRVVLQDNNPWQVVNFRSSDTPLDTSATN